MDTLDGDYQAFKANDGAFVRKNFFGRDPRTLEMVAKMSDDDIWRLHRGGHDPQKVYAAFHRADNHKGQPTVLLIKTVKGFGMGKSRRGQEHRAPDQEADRRGHQAPSATASTSRSPTSQLADIPFYKPADDTPEMKYLHERRKALGGYLPQAPHQGRRAASRCRRSTPSRPCSSRPPKAARSPPRRPTCAS